jgi:hypothetical protein
MRDHLDIALDDLAEARRKLEAAREVLRPVGNHPDIRQVEERLEQMAEALTRAEKAIAGQMSRAGAV